MKEFCSEEDLKKIKRWLANASETELNEVEDQITNDLWEAIEEEFQKTREEKK